MRSRQHTRKQSSLSLNPTNSLHFIQLTKFIQEYLHAQQIYEINYQAAMVQSAIYLPQNHQQSHASIKNVPYIQSEHYESHGTFASEENIQRFQNFTEKEEAHSSIVDSQCDTWLKCKTQIQQKQKQEFEQADFKFVKNSKNNTKTSNSNTTCIYGSSEQSEGNSIKTTFLPQVCEDQGLLKLQQTAYFLQEKEKQRQKQRQISLGYNIKNENIRTQNKPQDKAPSKKAMLLNKIQKQKTRKQMAQNIQKQRHYIKRMLK